MIKILQISEINKMKEHIGTNLFTRLSQNGYFFIPLADKKYCIKFQWLDGKDVTIYADSENFIVATDSNKVEEAVKNIDIPDDGILQLHEFFLELSGNDIYDLEALENKVISLEDRLLTEKHPRSEGTASIIKVRKDLIKVKRYYVEMEFLTDEIAAADPSFTFIDKKFDRLLDFVLHLQEYIEQVREAYQSQIDIEQNNLMKIFTVVTSIFLPLTLIAGWYGMNLQMPEFKWAMGYPFVIAISVIVVLGLVIFFKRKKWF